MKSLLRPVFFWYIVTTLNEAIVLYIFGRKVFFDTTNIVEVEEPLKEGMSYVFLKNGFRYQITPGNYLSGYVVQQKSHRLFGVNANRRLKPEKTTPLRTDFMRNSRTSSTARPTAAIETGVIDPPPRVEGKHGLDALRMAIKIHR